MTKAVRVHKVGGPEALVYEDAELAPPGPGEVRIRQHAVGLNFIDTYYRSGLYKAPGMPFIVGNEAAIRFGRQRVIVWFMCFAGITATTIAFSLGGSPEFLLALLLLYSIAIPADSGALTSGMSASAQPAKSPQKPLRSLR